MAEQTIPIHVVPVGQEELQVSTRRVDTGRGVRIHKTVSEQVRHVDQALLRDAVEVRRVAVDKIVPLSEAPATRHEGDILIVPVLEEILVLEKRVRIKEEIHIIRRVQEEPYASTVVLRAEQVSVERFDDSSDPEAKQ
ncbi:MAG: DUF2382 domain-containing protein [Pseudomonadota bacterium]